MNNTNTDKSNAIKLIDEIYKKVPKTYFELYFGDIMLLLFYFFVLFAVTSYFIVLKNIQPIKQNWTTERCKLQNILFAGIINKPNNATISEFTSQNFTYCTQNILKNITGYAMEPITYSTFTLTKIFSDIANSIQNIKIMLTSIRSNIGNTVSNVYGVMGNTIIPFQQILISLKDMMEKTRGILTAGLYTVIGAFITLQSAMTAIFKTIIAALVAFAAIILTMWFFPPLWGIAAASTASFAVITVLTAITLVFFNNKLHLHVTDAIPGVPGRPAFCFGENTPITRVVADTNNTDTNDINDIDKTSSSTQLKLKLDTVPISKIKLGDKILGSKKLDKVYGILKLSAKNVDMFNLNGVVVSGSHQVWNEKEEAWVYVRNHPDSVAVKYNGKYIYCLVTKSKRICVGKELFLDWDEENYIE
jgi:hypothetical protein